MSLQSLSRPAHLDAGEPTRPRILIAGDHELVARGIERVLGGNVDVVGVITNDSEVLSAASRVKPEIVVIDAGNRFLKGIETARRLHSSLPAIKLLFIAQSADRRYVEAAFRAGGHAYVLRQSAASEIRDAIDAIMKEKRFVSPSLLEDMPSVTELSHHRTHRLAGTLTPRKREVLRLVAEGKTAKEIAQILNISHKTVEFHKGRIMETLGLKTTAELTRYALEHRIIPMRPIHGT